MPKEDPYYTYTDFWPVPRTSRKVSWLLVLVAVGLLGLVVYLGAIWYF